MEIDLKTHLTMLLFSIMCVYIVTYLGLKEKAKGNTLLASNALGLCVLMFWIAYNIFYFLPENFDWKVSLPLHACDIIGLAAAIAMIKPTRLSRAILYFSAFALATQAFITPIGNQDPTTARFWFFWGLHIGIISAAIFDLVVRNYRPTFSDYLVCIAVNITYVMIVLPINIVFGWNYGYLGDSVPETQTIIDFLGAWPWRVAIIFFIVIAAQYTFLLPWQIARAIRNTS